MIVRRSPPPVAYVKVSGGLHNDMAVHDFDMARFIIDSEVTEVYCKGSCKVHTTQYTCYYFHATSSSVSMLE
jgi:predicted dehydrogenase